VKNKASVIISVVLVLILGVACAPCMSLFQGKKDIKKGKLGSPLAVGSANFTVISAEKKPYLEIGSSQRKPDGVYLTVTFSVENTSKETQRFKITQISLEDGKGRTYSYKMIETSMLAEKMGYSNPTLSDVQPGTPARFIMIFDISTDATGLKVNVKDFPLIQAEEGQIELGI